MVSIPVQVAHLSSRYVAFDAFDAFLKSLTYSVEWLLRLVIALRIFLQ